MPPPSCLSLRFSLQRADAPRPVTPFLHCRPPAIALAWHNLIPITGNLRCYLFILLRLDCIPPLPHFHPAAEEKRGCAKRSPLKHTATNVKQALQGAWQLNSTSLINTRPHCGRPVFSLLRPGAPRPSSSLCADNLTSPTEDKTKLKRPSKSQSWAFHSASPLRRQADEGQSLHLCTKFFPV